MNAGSPRSKLRDQPMTKEERQVEIKLKELHLKIRRNERSICKVFFRYEELIAVKASLVAGMEALREFREARIRNSANSDCSQQYFPNNS